MANVDVTELTPEKIAKVRSGIKMIVIWIINIPIAATLWALAEVSNGGTILPAIILSIFFLIVPMCLYMLQPNQAAVLTLFGAYRGRDETQGLRFTNLFYSKKKISLRVRNFTTQSAKVNDANGNPIEIGAVVVWRVVDVARAVFGVDNFTNYVHTQSESAVRNLARSFPYDSFEEGEDEITLIGDASEVNENLRDELQERTRAAGVEIKLPIDLAQAPTGVGLPHGEPATLPFRRPVLFGRKRPGLAGQGPSGRIPRLFLASACGSFSRPWPRYRADQPRYPESCSRAGDRRGSRGDPHPACGFPGAVQRLSASGDPGQGGGDSGPVLGRPAGVGTGSGMAS